MTNSEKKSENRYFLYFPLDMLVDICQKTGVLLDSCYTAKAVKGMVTEMNENPTRFKGNRILFIHTGNYTITQ